MRHKLRWVCPVAVVLALVLLVLHARSEPFDPHKHAVRVSVSDGNATSLGSGVIVDSGAGPVVITNHHVAMQPPGPTTVKMSNGRTLQAVVLASDKPHDLAMLRVTGFDGQGATVKHWDGTSSEYRAYGFGRAGKLRVFRGRRTGQRFAPLQGARWSPIEFAFSVQQGDSGGPVVNAEHQVVGVVWGADRTGTMATVGTPFVELLAKQQTSLGRCPPGKVCPVPVQMVPVAPPILVQPTPHRQPCDCKAEVARLEGIIAVLADQLAGLELSQGPAGPPGAMGPTGPVGPAGPTGTGFDVATIPPITVKHIDNQGNVLDQLDVRPGDDLPLRFNARK